jgi:hypothetical protein
MSKKRPLNLLALKPPKSSAPKKLKIARRSTIITNWKAKTRREERQNTTKQHEREQSDYLFVDNKKRQASHTIRARKIKYVAAPLVIAPLTAPRVVDTRSKSQLVDQTIKGSRADIQELKEKIRTVTNRIHHSTNKIKTMLKTHNIPAEEGQLKSLLNAQQDLASLPQQIDRAVSASSTLALVEGRHWRLVPHSLVHGLVVDTITSEREAELTTRLTRTPLKATRATVDEESTKQVDAFSDALAREIKATIDQSTSLETLQHAHNLICKLYEDAIIKTTSPDTLQRTAMYGKLQGTRVLMKSILRLRKSALAAPKVKGETDPALDLAVVPPPSPNLEQLAVAEKA